jgi:hypothetical protein
MVPIQDGCRKVAISQLSDYLLFIIALQCPTRNDTENFADRYRILYFFLIFFLFKYTRVVYSRASQCPGPLNFDLTALIRKVAIVRYQNTSPIIIGLH